MKRDDGLAIALFGLIMGGAVATAIASDVAAPACSAAKAQLAAAKDFDFGCLEFFFNRYQTTTQTVLSSALAGAGLYFVLKQLSALGQQNEMTRQALSISLEQVRGAHRAQRLQAQFAVNTYSTKAFTLQFEGMKAWSPNKQEFSFDIREFMPAEGSALQIMSALENQAEIDKWVSLNESYSQLVMYIDAKKHDMLKIWKGREFSLAEMISEARRLHTDFQEFGRSLVPHLET